MGLIAKQTTKRLVQEIAVDVGPWATVEAAATLGLTRRELIGTAVQQALLTTPSAKATSNWINAPGKYNSAEIAARTTSALLRFEGGLKSGDRVVVGSPDPATRLIRDWTLDVRCEGTRGLLDVAEYRTREDQIANKDVLNSLRHELGSVLLGGPRLTRADGPPEFASLLSPEVLTRSSSIFLHDYVVPLPPSVAGRSWTLELPAGSARALQSAIDEARLPQREPGGSDVRTIDLSGGRNAGTALRLVSDGDGDRLVAELSDPSATGIGIGGHHRDVRALFRTLRGIASDASEAAPAAAERIESFLTEVEAGNATPDRATRFVAIWDKETAAPVIRVKAGMRLPIAITFATSADGMLDLLIDAERWLLVRQRTWAKGFRRASRDKSRIFTSRRPMVLSSEDRIQPYLRYGDAHAPDLSKYVTTEGGSTWYWELSLRSKRDGATRSGALVVSGLSTADGFLAYGPEMASALRGFCWLLQAKDPGAQIRTVYLDLP